MTDLKVGDEVLLRGVVVEASPGKSTKPYLVAFAGSLGRVWIDGELTAMCAKHRTTRRPGTQTR